jgi:hypothetical protein
MVGHLAALQVLRPSQSQQSTDGSTADALRDRPF